MIRMASASPTPDYRLWLLFKLFIILLEFILTNLQILFFMGKLWKWANLCLVEDTHRFVHPSVGPLVHPYFRHVGLSVSTSQKVWKRLFPPLPTCPQLILAVYPALLNYKLQKKIFTYHCRHFGIKNIFFLTGMYPILITRPDSAWKTLRIELRLTSLHL